MLGSMRADDVIPLVMQQDNRLFLKQAPVRNSGFAVLFSMVSPDLLGSNPNTNITGNCCVFLMSSSIAITTEYQFRMPPKKTTAGMSSFYDAEGNFHESIPILQQVISSAEINRVLNKYISVTLNTNWVLESSNHYLIEEIYPVGDRQSTPVSEQLFWAVGRGFSSLFENVLATGKIDPATHARYVEIGGTFARLKGKWNVSLDTAADNLVHEAHFSPEGSDKPTLSITNSGVVECGGVKIAQVGMFDYYGYKILFEVKNFTQFDPGADPQFVKVLENFQEPLPPGQSEIMDRCKKAPERISVKF
jgi:hypothetical protein